MWLSKKYNIYIWTVVEYKKKVAWKESIHLKFKYLKFVFKYSTWLLL